jgi:hypothetical protein
MIATTSSTAIAAGVIVPAQSKPGWTGLTGLMYNARGIGRPKRARTSRASSRCALVSLLLLPPLTPPVLRALVTATADSLAQLAECPVAVGVGYPEVAWRVAGGGCVHDWCSFGTESGG